MFKKTAPLEVFSEDHMLTEEQRFIVGARGNQDKWMGVALSGGGIRSATFCLGALQRLAKAGLLTHFDYMSSVSGGGYTGASLQWWWLRDPHFDAGSDFPYGTALTSALFAEDGKLSFLRWHSNYLAPGGGISIWSGLAVLLRTLGISLFVWLPPTIFVFVVLRLAGAGSWTFGCLSITVPYFAIAAAAVVALVAFAFLLATVALMVISVLVPAETTDNQDERIRRALKCAIFGIAVCVVAFFLAYRYGRWGWSGMAWQDQGVFLSVWASLLFGVAALVVAVLQGLNILQFGVNYSARRSFDIFGTYAFKFFIGFIILASLPFAAALISHYVEGQAAKGALLAILTSASGVLSGLYGHFVQAQRVAPKYAATLAATVVGALFLYSFALVAYFAAEGLVEQPAWMPALAHQYCRAAFLPIFLFSVLFGWIGNLNYLGLHRFYRDRLMETFLPSDTNQAAEAPRYSEADVFALADFWPPAQSAPLRPYPLFNTNAILINDRNPTVACSSEAPTPVGSGRKRMASATVRSRWPRRWRRPEPRPTRTRPISAPASPAKE
jgi:hypothetical protein